MTALTDKLDQFRTLASSRGWTEHTLDFAYDRNDGISAVSGTSDLARMLSARLTRAQEPTDHIAQGVLVFTDADGFPVNLLLTWEHLDDSQDAQYIPHHLGVLVGRSVPWTVITARGRAVTYGMNGPFSHTFDTGDLDADLRSALDHTDRAEFGEFDPDQARHTDRRVLLSMIERFRHIAERENWTVTFSNLDADGRVFVSPDTLALMDRTDTYAVATGPQEGVVNGKPVTFVDLDGFLIYTDADGRPIHLIGNPDRFDLTGIAHRFLVALKKPFMTVTTISHKERTRGTVLAMIDGSVIVPLGDDEVDALEYVIRWSRGEVC